MLCYRDVACMHTLHHTSHIDIYVATYIIYIFIIYFQINKYICVHVQLFPDENLDEKSNPLGRLIALESLFILSRTCTVHVQLGLV
jgi:hypothetical protein